MKPWSTLERASAPDGAELVLQQRGPDFCIRANGQVLMGSGATGSEAALAEVTCGGLGARARVLVGGLGMGFTLRAALDRLPPTAKVLVAELVPQVVAWNRGPLAALAGAPLADPRVEVVLEDVRTVWRERRSLDAILLDVDNGPAALTRGGNEALYRAAGLGEAFAALGGQGVLAVWSAGPAPRFLRALHEAGFHAEGRTLPGTRHQLLLGWKGRPPAGRQRLEPGRLRGKGGSA